MIRISVWRAANGAPKRLLMTGHANRGPYGEDIVCAAASALVETLVLALTQVAHQSCRGEVEEGHADLTFHFPPSPEARTVVDTILVGLKDLADTDHKAVRFEEFKD